MLCWGLYAEQGVDLLHVLPAHRSLPTHSGKVDGWMPSLRTTEVVLVYELASMYVAGCRCGLFSP